MVPVDLGIKGKSHRIRFNGSIYRRYPESRHSSDRRYYRAGIRCCMQGKSYLHIDLWSFHNGPVPDGYEIDHIDGNCLNNDLSNLQAISAKEHKDKHREEYRQRGHRIMAEMPPEKHRAMLLKAAEWHRSEDGHKWHSQHSKNVFANKPTLQKVCAYCKEQFETKCGRATGIYCSNKCRSYARRDRGTDNETRTCKRCGVEFACNKYVGKKHCSRSCGLRRKGEYKPARLQSDG